MAGLSSTNNTYVPMVTCNNGGNLLVDILSSGQLDVCQGHAYPYHPHKSPQKVGNCFSDIKLGLCEIINIHGTSHRTWC